MTSAAQKLSPFVTSWTVPADLPYYDGHFPGNPVLPGIILIDKTLELLKEAGFASDLDQTKIKLAKFLAPILPNQCIEFTAETSAASDCNIEWKFDGKIIAEFKVQFLAASPSTSV